jgi:4a-hydroxytetrahydrobiopterin dehydratase
MSDLSKEKCVPCEGGVTPLTRKEFEQYLDQVKEWSVLDDKAIAREIKLKNFKDALQLINQVGEVAEQEGHHPDIYLHGWNKVTFTLSTHAIGGLSINDFVMASKIDRFI